MICNRINALSVAILRCDYVIYCCAFILLQLVRNTKGDVFCGIENPLTESHVTYCYGITAYCCGYRRDRCCWDSIWRVWWFWVVVLVVLGALFSCIGYFCTCVSDDWSSQGRASPFYAIRDGFRRRFSSPQESVADATDPYKDYNTQTVLLPPYYPSTSSVPVASAQASGAAYPDAPPPYTEQPSMTEHTPLLPVSTVAAVVNAGQNSGSHSAPTDRTVPTR